MRPVLVIWDDNCSFCARSVRLARALDWLRRLETRGSSDSRLLAAHGITREEADRELKVVEGTRVSGGFDAILRICARLPLTMLWAWIFGLPPLRQMGRHLYARVAQRRKCAVTLQHQ